MKICRDCHVEYDNESQCMCPIYRRRMERLEYSFVPDEWIWNVWEYGLYCERCKSEYWPSEVCDCSIYELWLGTEPAACRDQCLLHQVAATLQDLPHSPNRLTSEVR
jgi:hypothetical protein